MIQLGLILKPLLQVASAGDVMMSAFRLRYCTDVFNKSALLRKITHNCISIKT